MAALAAGAFLPPHGDHVEVMAAAPVADQGHLSSTAYDPAAGLTDVFGGANSSFLELGSVPESTQNFGVEQLKTEHVSTPVSAPEGNASTVNSPAETKASADHQEAAPNAISGGEFSAQTVAQTSAETHHAPESATVAAPATPTSNGTTVGSQGTISTQLVTTLKAGNGPPAGAGVVGAQQLSHASVGLDGPPPSASYSGDYDVFTLDGNLLYLGANTFTPITLSDVSNVELSGKSSSGDSGPNTFIIKNFTGNLTIDGGNGGDIYEIYAGKGGTVTINDSGTSGTDQVIVFGPDNINSNIVITGSKVTVQDPAHTNVIDTVNYTSAIENLNVMGGNGPGVDSFTINGLGASKFTTVNGGGVLGNDSFTVNAPLVTPASGTQQLVINGGLSQFGGDTLTINGTIGNDNFVITGFTVVGAGAPIVYGTIDALAINGQGGNDTFTLNGDSVPTSLNGGSGNDTFSVESNAVALAISGAGGSDNVTIDANAASLTAGGDSSTNFVVNGNSASISLTGGSAGNVFTVNGNAGSLALTGAGTSNTFNIDGNSSTLTADGSSGTNTFNVYSTSAPITLNGNDGIDTFNIYPPTSAVVTVDGGKVNNVPGTADLIVYGSADNDGFNVSSTAVTGVGAAIDYSGVTSLTVNGGVGDDTITVNSESVPTTINGGDGNNVINLRATSQLTTVTTGVGINTVNIGSNASYGPSKLDSIQGAIVLHGTGALDTVNLDDTASGTKTGTLTSTTITGLGMVMPTAITYGGVEDLNISLGNGGNTFTIASTSAGTSSVLNTGAGLDTVNVQSTNGPTKVNTGGDSNPNTVNVGSTSNTIDPIQGALTIVGGGSDNLNITDVGSSIGKNGTLTSTTLTGLGMGAGGITYGGIQFLSISLGGGGDTFTVASTSVITTTALNGGPGSDTVNVGNPANVLDQIQGPITIQGQAPASLAPGDVLNISDTGNTAAHQFTLNGTMFTRDGMAPITYGTFETLNIALGSGKNTFSISDNSSAATTTINGGGNPGSTLSATYPNGFAGVLNTSGFPVITSIAVTGAFAGSWNVTDASTISQFTISGDLTGNFNAPLSTITSMTVNGNLTITGQLTANNLVSLSIGKSSPGLIIANTVGTITVMAGIGPVGLRVQEGAIRRQIEVSNTSTVFEYYYQSTGVTGITVPQVAVRVLTPSGTFDLNLTAYNVAGGAVTSHTSSGKFNLERIDAGTTGTVLAGLRNLTIEGDLLVTLSAGTKGAFNLGSGTGGVQLPLDNVGIIAVRDVANPASILVKTIQAVAFGANIEENNTVQSGNLANEEDAEDLLLPRTLIVPATGTYPVPFGQNYPVALFLGASNGHFDNNPVYFSDQNATLTTGGDATSAVIATVSVAATNPFKLNVGFAGDGGSVQTQQWIYSITSTGPLGDLVLQAPQGVNSITAPSLLGNIDVSSGGITGDIQTTGIKINPITSATSSVSGDLGRFNSMTNTVTFIHSDGVLSGRLIVRGNLVSQVNADMDVTGVIAAQGTLGYLNGSTRLGGIKGNGALNGGRVVALGNIIGNVNFNGGLKSGRVLSGGAILGNTLIGGTFDGNSAIVATGNIGVSGTGGTTLSVPTVAGLIASLGTVNFSKTPSYSSPTAAAGHLFSPATGTNATYINNIFTEGGLTLTFDTPGSNPAPNGLYLILKDLTNLSVQNVGGVYSLTGTNP
jgi:hypothetical protein